MKKRLRIPIVPILLILCLSCSSGPDEPDPGQLELSVRNILELPTYEEVYRDIVFIGEQQKVLFFTTADKRVLFSVDIRIQAGIKNLDDIAIDITGENDEGTKRAVVYLPKSEVILADADENTIEQYFLKEQGGGISRLDYYNEINRKKEELVKSAAGSGMLSKADANARKLVQGFMALSGVEVAEFREAEIEK